MSGVVFRMLYMGDTFLLVLAATETLLHVINGLKVPLLVGKVVGKGSRRREEGG